MTVYLVVSIQPVDPVPLVRLALPVDRQHPSSAFAILSWIWNRGELKREESEHQKKLQLRKGLPASEVSRAGTFFSC